MKKKTMFRLIFAACVLAAPLAWAEHDHAMLMQHDHAMQTAQVVSATGEIRGMSLAAGKIKLRHDPIPALDWPAMVMDFKVKNKALLNGLKPGDAVNFTFEAGETGNVVTSIQKRGH